MTGTTDTAAVARLPGLYTPSTRVANGDELIRVPIHLSGGTIGVFQWFAGKGADNVLGRAPYYDGMTGTSSFSISVRETTRVVRSSARREPELSIRGPLWVTTANLPSSNTATDKVAKGSLAGEVEPDPYRMRHGKIQGVNWTRASGAPQGGEVPARGTELAIGLPESVSYPGVPANTMGFVVAIERGERAGNTGDYTWTEVDVGFLNWGPSGVGVDSDGGFSAAVAILTVDKLNNDGQATTRPDSRSAAIIGVQLAKYEGNGAMEMLFVNQGGPLPRASGPAGGGPGTVGVNYAWRAKIYPWAISLS